MNTTSVKSTMTDEEIVKTVESLKPGQVCLVYVKKINGGKFSVEVAERMESEPNLLALLNEGDERFSQARVRLAWINGTAEGLIKHLGLKLTEKQLDKLIVSKGIPDSSLKDGKSKINLGIVNPTVQGNEIHIRIEEREEVPYYEGQEAKRAGAGGDFILSKNNKLIYAQTVVGVGKQEHSKVPTDGGRLPAGSSKFPAASLDAAKRAFIGDDEDVE